MSILQLKVPTPDENDEYSYEVIVLSPFKMSSTNDIGYFIRGIKHLVLDVKDTRKSADAFPNLL